MRMINTENIKYLLKATNKSILINWTMNLFLFFREMYDKKRWNKQSGQFFFLSLFLDVSIQFHAILCVCAIVLLVFVFLNALFKLWKIQFYLPQFWITHSLHLCFLLFFEFQINLRLILVSGKTKEFLFSPSDSAGDIAQYVFDNWPEGEFKLNKIVYLLNFLFLLLIFNDIGFVL